MLEATDNLLAGQGAADPDVIEQAAGLIADAQPTAINGRSTDAARALANAGLLAKPVDWDMIERAAGLLVARVGRAEVTRSDIGLARDMFAAAGLLAGQGAAGLASHAPKVSSDPSDEWCGICDRHLNDHDPGQGAADDDTTRLRAENELLRWLHAEASWYREELGRTGALLLIAQRDGLADELGMSRDRPMGDLLARVKELRAENEGLRARIDSAVAATLEGSQSDAIRRKNAYRALTDGLPVVRATGRIDWPALTQVSRPQPGHPLPQPPRPDGRPQGDPTPCDCGQAPQHHHHIEGGPAVEVSRP